MRNWIIRIYCYLGILLFSTSCKEQVDNNCEFYTNLHSKQITSYYTSQCIDKIVCIRKVDFKTDLYFLKSKWNKYRNGLIEYTKFLNESKAYFKSTDNDLDEYITGILISIKEILDSDKPKNFNIILNKEWFKIYKYLVVEADANVPQAIMGRMEKYHNNCVQNFSEVISELRNNYNIDTDQYRHSSSILIVEYLCNSTQLKTVGYPNTIEIETNRKFVIPSFEP